MNFALSDEQEFLKEAARGALSRFKTVEAAREALDGGELPDLWPTAVEAGWPGLLVSEDHGGAGLGAMEAMLVFAELGRVLAGVPLLGHLPATCLLDRAGDADVAALAARRARAPRTCPPGRRATSTPAWTSTPRARLDPRAGADATRDGDGHRRGRLGARRARRRRASSSCSTTAARRSCRPPTRTSSRSTRLRRDPLARPRDASTARPRRCSTLAARTTRRGLVHRPGAAGRRVARRGRASRSQVSVAYAKERFTFGRAIGSYQAVKHELVEILRAARERPLAHVLHGLGRRRTSRRSSRSPRRRSGSPPARRSTTPRARRSPSTAGSARRGSTTRRCTSAARSCSRRLLGGHGRRRRPRGRRAADQRARGGGLAAAWSAGDLAHEREQDRPRDAARPPSIAALVLHARDDACARPASMPSIAWPRRRRRRPSRGSRAVEAPSSAPARLAELGAGEARAQRRDDTPVPAQLGVHRLGERLHERLAGRVGGEARAAAGRRRSRRR